LYTTGLVDRPTSVCEDPLSVTQDGGVDGVLDVVADWNILPYIALQNFPKLIV